MLNFQLRLARLQVCNDQLLVIIVTLAMEYGILENTFCHSGQYCL